MKKKKKMQRMTMAQKETILKTTKTMISEEKRMKRRINIPQRLRKRTTSMEMKLLMKRL